jgi:RNAse (barnase) inhibitor barstar
MSDLPVLVIDGARFADLDGFAREFSRLLRDYTWRGNLDAFNDILRGGFGTPENGWVLRWLNSERSRNALGPTLFDQLVDIIRDHGPGGAQWRDGVVLELA